MYHKQQYTCTTSNNIHVPHTQLCTCSTHTTMCTYVAHTTMHVYHKQQYTDAPDTHIQYHTRSNNIHTISHAQYTHTEHYTQQYIDVPHTHAASEYTHNITSRNTDTYNLTHATRIYTCSNTGATIHVICYICTRHNNARGAAQTQSATYVPHT